jgi:hypothetical protein
MIVDKLYSEHLTNPPESKVRWCDKETRHFYERQYMSHRYATEIIARFPVTRLGTFAIFELPPTEVYLQRPTSW